MSEKQPSGRLASPTVGIVVLNWESYEDTAECLRSLKSLNYPSYDVFVVDNGSTDGSGEQIDDEFDWVDVIYNGENRGAAAGNNPGIEHALDTGVDYVLLLNEDTVVSHNFLEPLVDTMESHDDVAAVGGMQYTKDRERVLNAGIWFFPVLGGRVRVIHDPLRDRPYGSGPIPPFLGFQYIPSSMVLLAPDFLRDHDVMCEDYFLGMEDVDLAYQAWQNDWKVLVNPSAEIIHKEGRTLEWSTFKMYHFVRNRLQFGSNRLPLHQHVPYLLMFGLTLLWFSIRWNLRGRNELIQASLIGVGDYIAGESFRDYEFFE